MTHVSIVVRRATDGDETAWQQLVERYGPMLSAVGGRFRLRAGDTEDAAQLTWLGLFQNVDRINDPESIGAWLATTMRRNCLRLISQHRDEPMEDWMQDTLPDDRRGVDSNLLTRERNQLLWRYVSRLPPRQSLLIRALFTGSVPSYDRIARELSISVGTIGPTRQRALRQLRLLLDESGVQRHELDVVS
ncbi:RNA polymerase sigma factor [Micromonospora wenchangensis]|uniref:RNA polymerase sigma factor n=1 Tax=Micromonospora wenchangensis TaxID=1185415 RepID=UPI003806C4F8